MDNYNSLVWTWKCHENMSLVLAKTIPAASQSQPHKNKAKKSKRMRDAASNWELQALN